MISGREEWTEIYRVTKDENKINFYIDWLRKIKLNNVKSKILIAG